MSNNLKKNLPLLQCLSELKDRDRKYLLCSGCGGKDLFKAIAELLKNSSIKHNNIPLSDKVKKRLNRKTHTISKLLNHKQLKLAELHEVVRDNQQGGAYVIGQLLHPALSAIKELKLFS